MANAILGLLAETSIHAGASTSAGVIDLPIQREAHTGWPCVVGSGVKGALRTAAEDLAAEGVRVDWVNEVFGPPSGPDAALHAGALAVGDARLLLLPVRSLTGHFKWATCPSLLRRALADCQRMGLPIEISIEELAPNDEQAIVPQHESPPTVGQQQNNPQPLAVPKLFLEELSFTEQPHDLAAVITFLAKFMDVTGAAKLLAKQLAIVSDDIFAHLSQFATPVAAHIAIENATKTVKGGALWYEETLPPETVLYVCLLAQKSRKQDSAKLAAGILEHITQELFGARPYLQIGGNETVGMGWCKVATLVASTREAA